MGKPFASELANVWDTFEWSKKLDTNNLNRKILASCSNPLFIVGSGGSLSACYYAAGLYQELGVMAKAITPLELQYSRNALKNSNIMFVSASGKNTDILLAYETALQHEPKTIFSFCMKEGSPLAKLANTNSIGFHFDFTIPSGKDGFLATNSLIAFFTILYKSIRRDLIGDFSLNRDEQFTEEINLFVEKLNFQTTITVLSGGWGQPIAIDLESKFAEAALSNVLISDYRNFGHGRHHWFDKRFQNSAIVALVTPDEKKLATKTLSILPNEIPILTIESVYNDPASSIDLLVKSFSLVNAIGERHGIDPGKPGVPDFGRKLYNLKYKSILKNRLKGIKDLHELAITRKAKVAAYNLLTKKEKQFWNDAFSKFIKDLTSVEFGCLILDYDGTICSLANRFIGIDERIRNEILRILESGIVLGIATGRGKSVRKDLEEAIPSKYWAQIIIGYYNCSEFGYISEENVPNKSLSQNPLLASLHDELHQKDFIYKPNIELKPNQIVIKIEDECEWSKIRSQIVQFVQIKNISNIQVLESSHSMDIIDITVTNKLNILENCRTLATKLGFSNECLCIGDRGNWPGNDFQLLSSKYSLSVDEVSSIPENCWNLSNAGIKNTDSTLNYFSHLAFGKHGLTFKLI